jgi:carboxylesterase
MKEGRQDFISEKLSEKCYNILKIVRSEMMEKYPVIEGADAFYFDGNETGILVLHGFTGTTQSVREIGKAYNDAGYTVCGPRLTGHGTHYEDMEQSTYQDWISSVEDGLKWLKKRCSTIFVTGLSMGGTLTLYLAEKHSEIKGIIPINAAIEIPDMNPYKESSEPRYLEAIGSDLKNIEVKELAYEKTPVKSIKQILKLMEIVKNNLQSVSCPALLFVSKEDHVVPPYNSEHIIEAISSEDAKLITLNRSYHVATLDYDQKTIIDQTLMFIQKYK